MRPVVSRAVWILLAVLVVAVAGITHIVAVLALPWRGTGDAYARVAALTAASDRATLTPSDAAAPPLLDPAMLTDVCRFDLGKTPFRLVFSPFADGFVTLGFHGRHGVAFYGLTVRASDATAFDLVLSNVAEDRATADADAHRVVVTAPEPEGFVTLSTPLGGGSEREAAEDRLGKVACRSDTAKAP